MNSNTKFIGYFKHSLNTECSYALVDVNDKHEFLELSNQNIEKAFYLSDKGRKNIWWVYLFLKFSRKNSNENLVLANPEENTKLLQLEKWLHNIFKNFIALNCISPNLNNLRFFNLHIPKEFCGSDYLKELMDDLKNIHKEVLIKFFWFTPFYYDGQPGNLIFKRDLVEQFFAYHLTIKSFPKFELFIKRIKLFFKKFFAGQYSDRLQYLSIYLFFLAEIKHRNFHYSESIVLFHRALDSLSQSIAFTQNQIQKLGDQFCYDYDDKKIFLIKTLNKITSDNQLLADAREINEFRRFSIYAHDYNNFLDLHANQVRSKSISIFNNFLRQNVTDLANTFCVSDTVNLEEFFSCLAANQCLFSEQSF